MPALAPAADGEGGVVTWQPSCDPARMARWQAIDRERASQSARRGATAPEPTEALPVAAAPAEPRPARRRWGALADRGRPAAHRVFSGPSGVTAS